MRERRGRKGQALLAWDFGCSKREQFGENLAFMALTVDWLLPTRLGAAAVMAGLDPALHAPRPRDEARRRRRWSQRLQEQRFLRSHPPLGSFCAESHGWPGQARP